MYSRLNPSSLVLCALLIYGICVVGGNSHSGFAFAAFYAAILPQDFNNIPKSVNDQYVTDFFQLIIPRSTVHVHDNGGEFVGCEL